MEAELTRTDWENLERDAINMIKRAKIDQIQFEAALKVCKEELKRLPAIIPEKNDGKEKPNNTIVK